jgi:acetoin utilization deacetylase AcuC-like enzyme
MPCSEADYRYRLTRANTGDRVIAERETACLGGQIMACTLHVAWDDRLAGYDFGAGHPLAPARVELTIELARAFGLFAAAGVSVERPAPATDAELGLVHVQPYIAAVRRAGGPEPALRRGNSAWAPWTTRCSRACMTRRR